MKLDDPSPAASKSSKASKSKKTPVKNDDKNVEPQPKQAFYDPYSKKSDSPKASPKINATSASSAMPSSGMSSTNEPAVAPANANRDADEPVSLPEYVGSFCAKHNIDEDTSEYLLSVMQSGEADQADTVEFLEACDVSAPEALEFVLNCPGRVSPEPSAPPSAAGSPKRQKTQGGTLADIIAQQEREAEARYAAAGMSGMHTGKQTWK